VTNDSPKLSKRSERPSEQVGTPTTATPEISKPSCARVAERYWIVSYGDEELRFSLRSAAEKWATALEAQGVNSEVRFHDQCAESSEVAPSAAFNVEVDALQGVHDRSSSIAHSP
jgi:hypothetical protein